MFLVREDWKDAIGSVDRKGLLTPMKRVFDDWNGNKPIVCFYIPDEFYRNDPSNESPILVENIYRSKLTNNKPCVIGTKFDGTWDRAYMFIKNGAYIINMAYRYHSMFDDSDSVIILDSYWQGRSSEVLYFTNKKYDIVNPARMSNVHRCENKAEDYIDPPGSYIDIYTARIESIGNKQRYGNFVILYDNYIFLFNIDEKKMEEVEKFVDSISKNVRTKLAANGTREDVAYFTIKVGNNMRELKIENMTDAFTCI